MQLVALFGLVVLGAAFVYSATMVKESARLLPWYNQSWFRQIVWYALGTGVAAAVCLVGYHGLARWSTIACASERCGLERGGGLTCVS